MNILSLLWLILLVMNTDNLQTIHLQTVPKQTTCTLQILIQIVIYMYNLSQEVGYVTQIAILISMFTQTQISLIRIGIWVKGLV